jgi:hypothetical protein
MISGGGVLGLGVGWRVASDDGGLRPPVNQATGMIAPEKECKWQPMSS